MSATPITDKHKFRVGDSDHYAVHVVYVAELERELNATIAKLRQEVKNAFQEGWDYGCYREDPVDDFEKSRAKRIAEGLE